MTRFFSVWRKTLELLWIVYSRIIPQWYKLLALSVSNTWSVMFVDIPVLKALFVDDSSFDNSSNVGLLRNLMSIWNQSFSESCGSASNLCSELSTIWRCLQLAWDLVYKTIIFEPDSKTTLNLITDTTKQYDFHFMQLCFLLLGSFLLFFEKSHLPIYYVGREWMCWLID